MRRVKIFPIDERALLDMLTCWKGGRFIQLPSAPRIPDGCEIVQAHHSWECRSLMVMLEHPSFEEVPPGQEPPRGEFIEYEALERIPVASQFQKFVPVDPYADWEEQVTYRWQQDVRKLPSGRFLELEYIDAEIRSPVSRYIRGISGPQDVRDGTLRLKERDWIRIMDGDIPGGMFCPDDMAWISWCFMPAQVPVITSYERWLTVENLAKYTVGKYSLPNDHAEEFAGSDPAEVERYRRKMGR